MDQSGSKDKTLRICKELFHDPFNDLGEEEVTA
jgi:alpha-beta hydrolase superfamily lysophospholipase